MATFPALMVEEDPGAPPDTIHARAGTWVEPPTFRKPAGWLPHMKVLLPVRPGIEPTAVRGK